jgi:hypothetical protein
MEPEGSLPHSQEPATCPYPEPAQSSPHTHIPRPEDHVLSYFRNLMVEYRDSQRTYKNIWKGKAVPLQAWSGPEVSRKLRFPDFLTTAQDGGKISLTNRPHLPSGNTPGTHFC